MISCFGTHLFSYSIVFGNQLFSYSVVLALRLFSLSCFSIWLLCYSISLVINCFGTSCFGTHLLWFLFALVFIFFYIFCYIFCYSCSASLLTCYPPSNSKNHNEYSPKCKNIQNSNSSSTAIVNKLLNINILTEIFFFTRIIEAQSTTVNIRECLT